MARLLEDKTLLVTGAASGIGRAVAETGAREGARVVVSDVDETGGAETVAHIEGAGGAACFVRADVTRNDEVAALVASAITAFGRLDAAVNNAGISVGDGPLHETSLENWERTLAVNLTGVFLCLKHEIPPMQAQGSGAIVNLSSGAGLIATPTMAAYCASKHGVLGLTKTAALENARTGVRVNAVLPGSVDTPALRAETAGNPVIEKMVLRSQPGGKLGTPEEIAEAVVWLCSDRASFVTGSSMLVDGGAVMR